MTRRALTIIRILTAVYWAGLFYGTHKPSLHVDVGMPIAHLDKWIHFVCFGGLLVWLALSRVGRRPVLWATLIVLAYLPIDEITQHGMQPQRTLDWYDVLAGAAGVVAAALGMAVVRYLRRPATSFVDHARLVSAVTMFSRCFGLVRDWALAFALGFGWIYDALVIALMIPNLFRRLFGEGALAAAFVPHYTRLDRDDPDTRRRFALLVLELLFAGLAGLSLLICASCLAAVWLAPDWPIKFELTGLLTAITIWYMPLVCVLAVLGAMLQVHKRFGAPAAAPVLLNVFIITAALIGHFATREIDPVAVTAAIAGAVALAGVAQVVWLKIALRRMGISLEKPPPPWKLLRDEPTRQAGRAMLRQWFGTVLGLAVLQINVLLDAQIAMIFSAPAGETLRLFGRSMAYPMLQGDVAVLGAAARLYEFPLGVFAIAIATAIFPALSRANDQPDKFAGLLRQGLRLAMFIALPAGVGLILVRQPLARAIYYEVGNIGAADALRIAAVLLGYASAIWAYSLNHVLVRAFYAQHNPRTPMFIALSMVALNVPLNLTLIWSMGAAGLAWSTAICAFGQTLLLLWKIRRYVDRPIDRAVWAGWAKTAGLTVILAGVVYGFLMRFDVMEMSWAGVAALLIGAVALGGLVMLVGGRSLKMDELKWVLGRRRIEPGEYEAE